MLSGRYKPDFPEILQDSFAITSQLAVFTAYPGGAALAEAGPFVFGGKFMIG